MLDLYFWTTPNGYKVTILLEELGLQYNVVPVHIGKGEQFNPDFLKINPNNKIPALDKTSPHGRTCNAGTTQCALVPAVQRGLAVMSERLGTSLKKPSSEAWNVLFGEKQFEAR